MFILWDKMKVLMKDKDGVIQRRYINSKNFDKERMEKVYE